MKVILIEEMNRILIEVDTYEGIRKVRKNKINKHFLILAFIICCSVFFCVVRYNEKIETEVKKDINSIASENVVGGLQQGDEIEQIFNNKLGPFSSIYLKMATYGKTVAGFGELKVYIEDFETGVELATGSIDLRLVQDNEEYKVVLSKTVNAEKNTLLKLRIYAENISENSQVTFWLGKEKEESKNTLVYNGVELGDGLMLSLAKPKKDAFSKIYIVVCLVVILLIAIEYCNLFIWKQCSIEWNFIIIVITMGFVYLMLFPEYTAPDEGRHINTAYSVSDSIMGYHRNSEELETEANSFASSALERKHYDDYMHQLIRTNKGECNLPCTADPIIDTPRYQYLPAAIGLCIGRIFHLGVVRTLLLGSIANFLFFIVCFFYAIKKIPLGKRLLVILGMLPMTMQQVTSYSYDCIVISLAVVCSALALKILYEKCDLREKIVFIISLLLLLPTKQGAYFAMGGLLILVLLKLRKENFQLYKKIVMPCILFIIVLVIYKVIGRTAQSAESTGMLEYIDAPAFSLSYLLTHIPTMLQIIGNTVFERMDFYFTSTIGGSLGWFQIPIPLTIVCLCAFMMIGTSIKSEDEKADLDMLTKTVFWIIAIVCLGCIEAGMWLGWTPIYSRTIEGVQGRYFLPFILLPLLTLKNKNIVLSTTYANAFMFGMTVLQLPIVISIMEGFA